MSQPAAVAERRETILAAEAGSRVSGPVRLLPLHAVYSVNGYSNSADADTALLRPGRSAASAVNGKSRIHALAGASAEEWVLDEVLPD